MMRRLRNFRPEALKQDPLLLAILLAIALLVIASLALFFVRQAGQEYLPEYFPQAVVHNYLLALHRGDLEQAYGYLVETSDQPDFEQFRLTYLTLEQDLSQVYLQLGEVRQSGGAASVSLIVTHTSENPFQGSWEAIFLTGSFTQNELQIVEDPEPALSPLGVGLVHINATPKPVR